MKFKVFFIIYRYILAPLLILLYFIVVLAFSKKQRRLFKLRKDHKTKIPSINNQVYWFHASSGEFEYAKSLIRIIKNKIPNAFILVTYSSPSYAKQIKNFEYVDDSLPLPLDIKSALLSFLKTYKPKLLLLARSDLWPEMLQQCKEQSIPRVLFATSFHQKQSPLSKLWKQFNLRMIDTIYLNHEEDKALLNKWGLDTNMVTVGDPRFDETILRKNRNQNKAYFLEDKVTLMAASTWPEDEKAILPTIIDKITKGQLNLIIAPHEVTNTHINSIESRFKENKINYTLLSNLKGLAISTPVLLIDKIGFLADFYKIADFSFVGGSFKKRVHSVMESLVEGKAVVVGPHYKNNPEAIEFQKVEINDIKAVQIANNTKEFADCIELLQKNHELLEMPIINKVNKCIGASQRIYADLAKKYII